jgi:hypothetical protein
MNDVEGTNKAYEEWVTANKTTLQAAYAETYFPLFQEFCRETYLHDTTPGKILWDEYDDYQERKRNVNEDDPRKDR